MSEHPHAHPAYVPGPGRFVWHDLMTREAEVVQPFNEGLFGWTVTPLEMGGGVVYRALTANGKAVGGIVQEPNLPEGVPSHWVSYVLVEDLDACSLAAYTRRPLQLAARVGGDEHLGSRVAKLGELRLENGAAVGRPEQGVDPRRAAAGLGPLHLDALDPFDRIDELPPRVP